MRLLLIALSVLLLSFVPLQSRVAPADIVFNNGNVYTANDKAPQAQAIAVKGDRILFVGTNEAAQKYVGPNTRVIDLHGNTVLPGFTDSHQHLSGVGQREMTLNLEGTTSLEDLLAKVKARVDQAKPGEWVTGRGWIETHWTPPVFPTRWDLDKVSPANPVILGRADGHGGRPRHGAGARGRVPAAERGQRRRRGPHRARPARRLRPGEGPDMPRLRRAAT